MSIGEWLSRREAGGREVPNKVVGIEAGALGSFEDLMARTSDAEARELAELYNLLHWIHEQLSQHSAVLLQAKK